LPGVLDLNFGERGVIGAEGDDDAFGLDALRFGVGVEPTGAAERFDAGEIDHLAALTADAGFEEFVMRRYERARTLLTSNRPVEDWGKLLGDSAAVTAMLGRLLHHGHLLKCGPRSWRTKMDAPEH